MVFKDQYLLLTCFLKLHVWWVFTVHGVNRSIPCSACGSLISILNGENNPTKPKSKGLSTHSTSEHLQTRLYKHHTTIIPGQDFKLPLRIYQNLVKSSDKTCTREIEKNGCRQRSWKIFYLLYFLNESGGLI